MKTNQVQLIGNVGADVKVENDKVVRFSIAVNENIPEERDSNGKVTKWGNKANWFNIVVFNPKKEWYEKLKKGTRVLVTGKLRPDVKNSEKCPGFSYTVYEIAAETTLIIETQRQDGVQTTTITQQARTEASETPVPQPTETTVQTTQKQQTAEQTAQPSTEPQAQEPTQQAEQKPATEPAQMPSISEMEVIEDLPF